MIRTVITESDVKSFRQLAAMPVVQNRMDLAQYNRLGLGKAGGGTSDGAILARAKKTVPERDNYLSRLVKYIPAEVVALYLTIDPLLRKGYPQELQWALLLFGLVVTPFYLMRLGNVRKTQQLVISTLAFAVWVFAIGGPFGALDWYIKYPACPAIAVSVYTFLVPLIEAKK